MELSAILYTVGKWSGAIGFFCLAFLIFSGDTARFWDKWFGLDRIIKFQRKFSLFTALFVILHPIFFILSTGVVVGFLVPNFTYFPLALGIISMYIFILVMIASHFYKRVSYKMWQYIHVVTYILFGTSVYHAFNWGSDAELLTPLYAITTLAVLIGVTYRTQYKIQALRKGVFIVKGVTQETHDTYTLHIDQEKKLQFEAGQFCFLRLDGKKLHARHPFTVSSSPHEDELRFTIKDSGRFTSTARTLTPGSKILIDGPFGKFKAKENKDLVFIAGGVGITPFMSMILANGQKENKQNITLLYGSKTEADIIFKQKFDAINENWFKKVYVLSNADNPDPVQKDISQPKLQYEKGFISGDLIKKYVTDTPDTIYYICGPETMKNIVRKTLETMGVPKDRVLIEDFFW